MTEILLLCLVFACGSFCGFIAAAMFAVGRRADDRDEFDGGYSTTHQPPARTRIWSDAIKKERME